MGKIIEEVGPQLVEVSICLALLCFTRAYIKKAVEE